MSERMLTRIGRIYNIVLRHERLHNSPLMESRDKWRARRYISDFYSDSANRKTLRGFLEQKFNVAVQGLNDSRILDHLASRMAAGDFQIVPLSPDPLSRNQSGLGERTRGSTPAKEKTSEPIAGWPSKKKPVPVAEDRNDWIEIALVDEDGKPARGERYEIQQTGGLTLAAGTLNADGFARVDGIVSGEYEVVFPDLEQGLVVTSENVSGTQP